MDIFLQSVDFSDYDASAIADVPVESGLKPSSSPTSELDGDSISSSPAIDTEPIRPISQSPFFVAQQVVAAQSPALKSIIKYPQSQQRIEIELIQPQQPSAQLNCEVVFTSEPPQTTNDVNEMSSETPTIAINGSNDPSDLFDPWCDPKNPKIVQFQDISAAAFKIKSGIMVTPCTRSHLSNLTGTQIFFKKDFLQYTGSFKVTQKKQNSIIMTNEPV